MMIVGDDSKFIYLIQRYVLQMGYRIAVTYPNPPIVDIVRHEKPAAILIDIESTQPVGWDVVRMLRADNRTQNIPIVICSWLDDKTRSLEEGADTHLRKPVMYSDVFDALAAAGVPLARVAGSPSQEKGGDRSIS
ncbi:MAG: response regulator [Anaerolineae bacterium]|nr:response regulator [Anaerolineae bacterium]